MIVSFDPAALEEIVEVVEWYVQHDSKVARRFLAAVDAAMTEVTVFPDGLLCLVGNVRLRQNTAKECHGFTVFGKAVLFGNVIER